MSPECSGLMTSSSWKSSLGCGAVVSGLEVSRLSASASSTSVASHRLSSTAGCSAVSVAVCEMSASVTWTVGVVSGAFAAINTDKLQWINSTSDKLHLRAAIFFLRRHFRVLRHASNQPMGCFHMDACGADVNLFCEMRGFTTIF